MAHRREPDRSIDLHHLTCDQAIRQTHQQLLRIRSSGQRCLVEVITGKGEHSQGGQSVIRPAVKQWLENEGRQLVGVRDVQLAPGGGSLLVQIGVKGEQSGRG